MQSKPILTFRPISIPFNARRLVRIKPRLSIVFKHKRKYLWHSNPIMHNLWIQIYVDNRLCKRKGYIIPTLPVWKIAHATKHRLVWLYIHHLVGRPSPARHRIVTPFKSKPISFNSTGASCDTSINSCIRIERNTNNEVQRKEWNICARPSYPPVRFVLVFFSLIFFSSRVSYKYIFESGMRSRWHRNECKVFSQRSTVIKKRLCFVLSVSFLLHFRRRRCIASAWPTARFLTGHLGSTIILSCAAMQSQSNGLALALQCTDNIH